MSRYLTGLLCLSLVTGIAMAQGSESDEGNPFAELDWVTGPIEVTVGGQAKLLVPEGFVYLHPDDTAKFQELNENPGDVGESLVASEQSNWFGLLRYEDVGYIKDDEEINPVELLRSIREGTEVANAERRRRGWAEVRVIGWRFEPRYDSQTNRLEWAIEGESEGRPVVNFNTRLLGRSGFTSATLVASDEDLDAAVVEFKQVLSRYEYLQGQRYADVQEGDKMAEYGLAALIAGGGAAVAAKTGLLKSLSKFFVVAWKFIAIGVVALFAGIWRFFTGKRE